MSSRPRSAAASGSMRRGRLGPYLTDFRRLYRGATPLVLLPRSVESGGRDPADLRSRRSRGGAARRQHQLLRRRDARRKRHANRSVAAPAESRAAGRRRATTPWSSRPVCTLAAAQAAAREADRLFPLSLGSEGTAQIGGNLSTNAGGTAVLRYGMMRDLVLGLEVVLADGRVLAGAQEPAQGQYRLRRQVPVRRRGRHARRHHRRLLEAVSRSRADSATALVGIDSPPLALDLLAQLRTAGGDQVTTFELMPRIRGRAHGRSTCRAWPTPWSRIALVPAGGTDLAESPAATDRA